MRLICIGFEIQDLYYNDACFSLDAANWSTPAIVSGQNTYSLCNDTYLMGGYDVLSGANQFNKSFTKSYLNLPTHSMIYFTISFWAIDSWNKDIDYFQVQFDSTIFTGWSSWNFDLFPEDICGNSNYGDLPNARLFGRVKHSAASLVFSMISDLDQTSTNEALGFRNIDFLFVDSPTNLTEMMCGKASLAIGTSNECSCSEGSYLNATSNCTNCHGSCASCFGFGSNYCFQCAEGYGFDGNNCIKCDASCGSCNGPTQDQCTTCASGYLLMNNNTCIPQSECTYPLTVTGCGRYCELPCLNNEWWYWNGSCISTCSSPLVQNTSGLAKTCVYPCSTSQILYWDGTCRNTTTCSYPLVQRIGSGKKYCDFKCNSTQFLYWNGSCLDTCQSPLVHKTYSNKDFCSYPCSTSQYLYYNGSCLDHCLPYYTSRKEAGENYCDSYCSVSQFIAPNSSCTSSCESPLRIVSNYSGEFCIFPCDNSSNYYHPDTNTCDSFCSESSMVVNETYLSCVVPAAETQDQVVFTRLLHHIRYLDVTMPPKLQRMSVFRGNNILSVRVIPSMFRGLVDTIKAVPLPAVFEKRDLHSSFLVNFIDDTILLIILIAIEVVLTLLNLCLRAVTCLPGRPLIEIIQTFTRLNLLLMLIATNVGDIIFFSVMELLSFNFKTIGAIVSLALCIVMLVVVATFFAVSFYLINESRKQRKEVRTKRYLTSFTPFAQEWHGFQVLFGGNHTSFSLSSPFFVVYTFRLALPMIIASSLFGFPLGQATLYLSINILILAFVLIKKPIKNTLNKINLIVIELLLLMVNICALILTTLSRTDSLNEQQTKLRASLGEVIIIGNKVIIYISIMFLIMKMITTAIKAHRIRKIEPLESRALWLQLLFIPLQQGCMCFEEVQIKPIVTDIKAAPTLDTEDLQVQNTSVDKHNSIDLETKRDQQKVNHFKTRTSTLSKLDDDFQLELPSAATLTDTPRKPILKNGTSRILRQGTSNVATVTTVKTVHIIHREATPVEIDHPIKKVDNSHVYEKNSPTERPALSKKAHGASLYRLDTANDGALASIKSVPTMSDLYPTDELPSSRALIGKGGLPFSLSLKNHS